MNYEEALSFIHGSKKFRPERSLESIRRLLELMGNPHEKLRFVHVAGTNGKGSTVSFISSILTEAGYKVGVFVSPFIERFTERIRIGTEEILPEELASITEFVKQKVDQMTASGENLLSEFDIITAIAMEYYCRKKCDVVVLEVGLGGRFDSTNVISTPLVSVITTINYDHMEYLGDTLEKIAFEKAGIIKPNGKTVLYPQLEEAERVLKDTARKMNNELIEVNLDKLAVKESGIDEQHFDFEDYHDLIITLPGIHQIKNACTAIKAAEAVARSGFSIEEGHIRRGIEKTRWAGRLEVLRKDPCFIIDGAHNPEGAEALRDALLKYFPDKRKIFIVGVLRDKDYKKLLEKVLPLGEIVIAVEPESPRALPASELVEEAKRYCHTCIQSDTINMAVEHSLKLAEKGDVICAFGSLYYIGRVRSILLKNGCSQ